MKQKGRRHPRAASSSRSHRFKAGFLLAPLLAFLIMLTTSSTPTPAYASAVLAPERFVATPEQQELLEKIAKDTFAYFWETTPADTGLTPDRYPGVEASSVAGIGFALTSYTVGAQRGWVSRAEASKRTLDTLRFLWRAPQGPGPSAVAGYKGFFYHFLDARTGNRWPGSELSTIDTALLMAGVLSSRAFFTENSVEETDIRTLAGNLYRRVDWSWARSATHPNLLSMGWSPEQGFIASDWQGYSEAMILYILALGSPTHPIDAKAWTEWTATYRWDKSDGFPRVAFDPLFGHQYSHVWIDFRDIRDAYMRAKGSDYFVNSTRATHANRAYCVANPAKWTGYDANVWGLTASDGPLTAEAMNVADSRFHAYWARGAGPDGRDDGTIAVTAVGGSVPFAPELTIPTLMHFYVRFGDRLYGKYGFKDAFNLSFTAGPDTPPGWFDDQYVAIDQGPILLMIENFRTGQVWALMRQSDYLRAGLTTAGFTGGWLGALERRTEGAPSSPPGQVTSAEVAPTRP